MLLFTHYALHKISLPKLYRAGIHSRLIELRHTFDNLNRRGGVEVKRSPRMREIGVRSPVATDLSRKSRLGQVHCQNAQQQVCVSRVLGDDHNKR